MRGWLGLWSALALVMLGCQSSQPVTDPFMRTRVPPPGTGEVGPVPVGTYGSGPPVSTVPPVNSAGTPYAPPGGNFNYGGTGLSPVTPPGSAPPPASIPATPYGNSAPPTYQAPATPPPAAAPQYAPPASNWAPTSSLNGPPTTSMQSRETLMRPLSETTRAGALAYAATDMPLDEGAAPGELGISPTDNLSKMPATGPLQSSPSMREIEPVSYMVPEGAPLRTAAGGSSGGSIVETSRTATGRPATGAGPADRGATYGFDRNYAWLQGQLEYAQATQQWKVRYVPIDGPTDRFGGSVVLTPSSALAAFKAGDYVSVKGRLNNSTPQQGSYAPLYEIASIDRLSD